jgi:hypothetical protein
MAREIKSTALPVTTSATQPNDYKDRLVKLIPSEIITAYITLHGLIISQQENQSVFLWIVFSCLVVLTPIYLYNISDVKKWGQISFTTVAFIIWVLAIGGFKIMLPQVAILNEFLGSLLLIIYTLLIPLVYKG